MKMISKFFNAVLISLVLFSSLNPITAYSEESATIQTININTASADVIAKTLKGVGKSKAEAIVQYRKTYGDFAHIEELIEVKGIGKATIAKNKASILLGE